MPDLLKAISNRLGFHASSLKSHRELAAEAGAARELLHVICKINGMEGHAYSQLGQDLMALVTSGFKRGGFFVEFGATNGIELSNSYLLEKEFEWNGILAEPMPRWHSELNKNRNCSIDTRCVWNKTGEILEFLDVKQGELSTLKKFADADKHSRARRNSSSLRVETVSLMDLLSQYNAPKFIDYMSIDTEGSEYEILKSFDFKSYSFGFITIEHNHTSNRQLLQDLMVENGYLHVLPGLSKWDDWFIADPIRVKSP